MAERTGKSQKSSPSMTGHDSGSSSQGVSVRDARLGRVSMVCTGTMETGMAWVANLVNATDTLFTRSLSACTCRESGPQSKSLSIATATVALEICP